MGHEFENDFALDWDLLVRTAVSLLAFLGGIVGAWLLPAVLRFLFRRLLRSEVAYHPPDHDQWYDRERDYARRRRYAHASYWRTSFFDLFYVVVALSAFLSGIVVALWLLHWDFWYLVAGLGLYTAIALFQVGAYLQNVFAFFCLKMDYQCHVREGDYIAVAGHQGVLAYVGLQRSKIILMPAPSAPSTATAATTTAAAAAAAAAATATTTVSSTQQRQQQQQHPSPHHRNLHTPPPSRVVFVPTAHLMQTVVRLERVF